MALSIMLQGTGSDVGKSVLVAGLCRLFARRGLAVRPFKPQNMSNNAAVADDGGELGRAQWLQALACNVRPSVHFNPVLLKPESETGSQVIVHGQVTGRARGRAYQELKPHLLSAVLDSHGRLAAQADLVIVEGAGSPAEINLRAGDIANMGFARAAGVPVVLVGDIDRGGVIASLVGTHAILPPRDRAMIVGYLINRFRGDVALFDDGLAAITRFTGWPSLGVVPWLSAAGRLPAEDSVVLERGRARAAGRFRVAVPVTGRIANFDDLDPLAAEPAVELVMVRPGQTFPADADLVVIAGSKSTMADLAALSAHGWDAAIRAHAARGGAVVGLCGGYQMLGRTVRDPDGLEGPPGEARGLGLLDVETVMEPQKTVRNTRARSVAHQEPLTGYEIHLGRTEGPDRARPVTIIDGRPEGAMSADGRIWGTYLHGIFDSGAFRRTFLAGFGLTIEPVDHRDRIDAALDELAEGLARVIDTEAMLAAARAFAPPAGAGADLR
ncbi:MULTISPECIES: cobyric acid synthase [unclassified Roseitalea]|uniref:cobyric acid synthase n=1 Tax=unclassified Roseitalea TaxID=2639107 RepID=UPI00273E0F9E|nr:MULTISPECIES: cobyric acid synthase [unclassified Roseitalea]